MKTILITGSNRGIGFETARQLVGRGHRVVLSGRDEKSVKEAAAGLECSSIVLDTGDVRSIADAVKSFKKLDLRLDVLINNAAALGRDDRSLLQADEVLPGVLQVNSLGPLRVTKAFLPLINRPGRIINISSGGGSMTDSVGGWSPAYCVSKSLLNAITRHLAYELEGERITVNAVCPGWVRTRMGGKSASRSVEKGAETPVWLAVDAPASVTGEFFRDKKQIPW